MTNPHNAPKYTKPNHPYLIRAKVADEANPQTISPSGNKIKICKSDENSIVCSSIESKYTFTGTYKDIAGMKANDCYLLSEGKLYKVTDDDVTLSAQRWYLSVESLDSQFGDDSTVDAKPMQFDIKLLDDNPTGIEKIQRMCPTKVHPLCCYGVVIITTI